MSELDKIIDLAIRYKADVFSENISECNKNEFVEALKKQKKQEIIDEVKQMHIQEIMECAEIARKKEINRQKIVELQKLMWSGFFLAFIVGLAVNQATDIIGYYKGSVTLNEIWSTVALTGILIFVCIIAYIYTLVKQMIGLFSDNEKKERKNKVL